MDTLWMIPVSVFASLGTSVVAGWFAVRHLARLRAATGDDDSDPPTADESGSPDRRRP